MVHLFEICSKHLHGIHWMSAVEAEREAAKKQTRSIFISELKESVTAAEIAEWFSRFGNPVDVKLNLHSE